MDKIIHQYLTMKRLRTIPVKTLGVIVVGLIFIMGLSACRTTQALSGHAKSKALAKNIYPDKKPSIAHVQSSPANSANLAAHHLGLNSIKRMQPRGEYSIYVLKNSEWRKAGTFKCDKFLREQSLDLSPFLTSNEPVQIRLVEKGGGAAHIDAILLGGTPPAKVKGNQEALWLKKISKRDFDVMDAFEKTFELVFPAIEKDKTLCLTARVEPEIISKPHFNFPPKTFLEKLMKMRGFTPTSLAHKKPVPHQMPDQKRRNSLFSRNTVPQARAILRDLPMDGCEMTIKWPFLGPKTHF